jgi:hypothetical protein
MIKYLYTGDYNGETEITIPEKCLPAATRTEYQHKTSMGLSIPLPPQRDELLFNTKMYILADMLFFEDLKKFAIKKYERAARVISNFTFWSFSRAAGLLWEETRENDILLKNVVARLGIQKYDYLLHPEDWTKPTGENKSFVGDNVPMKGSFAGCLLIASVQLLKEAHGKVGKEESNTRYATGLF